MKFKKVFDILLMVIQTILLVLLVTLTSIFIEINSSSILKTMEKAGYLQKAETSAKEALNNFLPIDKTEEVLKSISVKSQIKEMTLSLDNNTVEQVANEKKNEIKNEIIKVLDSSVDIDTKESFASTVSEVYIKAIFPVTEFKTLSIVNSRYSERLILSLVIILIISLGIYIYFLSGKKKIKWMIISIYNSIFFSVLIYTQIGMFNNISIGNINTTSVILEFIKNVKFNIIIGIILLIILCFLSNWKAYFRKRKHKDLN